MGLKVKLFSALGNIYLNLKGVKIQPGAVFYGLPRIKRARGSKITLGSNVALCSVNSGNPIGVNHSVILSTLRPESKIIIGDNVGLSGTTICAAHSVEIGNNCLIGANVTITDYDFHAVSPVNRRYNTNFEEIGCKPVIIKDNVWLGMNVIILKGVTIGENSVIAAGSVVAKSIPANCIAGGNPVEILCSQISDGKKILSVDNIIK